MATLSKKNRGAWAIQFRDELGSRKTISLGSHITERTAKEFREVVSRLIHCRSNSSPLDRRTEVWIQTASREIQTKLAKARLIEIPDSHTLGELWNAFLAQKTGVKESTIEQYEAAKKRFFEYFNPKAGFGEQTKDQLTEWKSDLLGKYKHSTVASQLKHTKTVFTWGVSQGWIEKSPLDGIGRGSFVNRKRDRIIPMDEYFRLLAASPCQDWRTIIALTRIGGLRCPSEVVRLKWEDVNWERNSFFVRSSKTEHHEGKESRLVPIFPELKTELETLFFDPNSEGSEYVINRYRNPKQNLGTTFSKIVKRAGLLPIARPFDNMRMTRSNEVYNRWGAFKESQWIGHSSRVRADHYLMLTDADFNEASGWKSVEVSTQKTALKN